MSQCSFKNYCDEKWDALAPLPDDPSARHCGRCQRKVYLTATNAETAVFSALGRCIAIAPNHELMEKIGWIGESSFDWMEAAGKVLMVDVRCSAANAAQQVTAFNQLFCHHGDYRALVSTFLAGEWVRIGEFDEKEIGVLEDLVAAAGIEARISPVG